MKTYILYHSPCADGHMAATIAAKCFRLYHPTVETVFIPMSYNDPVPVLEDGSDVFLLDFTFKRDVLVEIAGRMEFVCILDHHKTAQADLVDLPENVYAKFDMNQSGAQLSWEHFFGGVLPEPKLVSYVADRDLWKWELPNSREINAALFTYSMEFDVWETLMDEPMFWSKLIVQGEAILRNEEIQIQEILKRYVQAGYHHKVGIFPMVNAPYFLASEIGNRLLKEFPDAPLAAVYRDIEGGRREWSFRSDDTRRDVSEFAKLFGGGGHRNAAGATTSVFEATIAAADMSYRDTVKASEVRNEAIPEQVAA